ncbi:MAG: hypothetical protein K2F75_06760, partial [Paramuribaculum sp.]|nr:hypothetical protein [Paramuribaculum sp.]
KAHSSAAGDKPRRFKDSAWKPGRKPNADTPARPESENPLAARRNENALKMLMGKAPSLPKTDQPLMRPRRGWKKGE